MSRRSRARRKRQQVSNPTERADGVATTSAPPLPGPAGLTPASDAAYDAATVAKSKGQESSKSLNFGEMLRRERELRRISLREPTQMAAKNHNNTTIILES